MKCVEIEPLLYLKDVELTGEEKKLVEHHLTSCTHCRTLAEKISRAAGTVEQLAGRTPKADVPLLVNKTMAQIPGSKALDDSRQVIRGSGLQKWIVPVRWGLSLAALFLFILYIGQISGITVAKPVPENYREIPSGISRNQIIETIPAEQNLTMEEVDGLIRNLITDNTNTRPIEKVILEKYSNYFYNRAAIWR